MAVEDVQTRRGEPVIVTVTLGGVPCARAGTIEFGDETTDFISVYLEHGGRVIIPKGETDRITSSPGSPRPVWASLEPKGPVCVNCGKKSPKLILHEGKWYCPGACDVTRGKKL